MREIPLEQEDILVKYIILDQRFTLSKDKFLF